jgi:predicted DNA-binding transcriptional regulator AlpA
MQNNQKELDVRGAQLVTAREVARLLSVSARSVWRLRDSGRMPDPVRVGGSVRWGLETIRAWIAAQCPTRDRWIALQKGTEPTRTGRGGRK